MKVYLIKWNEGTHQAPTPWIFKDRDKAEAKLNEMRKSWGTNGIDILELELK